jgi:hypothetical protein
VDACLSNFSMIKDDLYPTTGSLYDIDWAPATDQGGYQSSQGGPALRAPAKFLANDLSDGRKICIALWEGMSYKSEAGSGCEIWFVPPGFDTSPIPIAGNWKGLDSSLSSIGFVEAPYWGA